METIVCNHISKNYGKKEILKNIDEAMKIILKITDNGMLVGLAINPETNLQKITPLLKYVDMVLVMSVKAGKGGQAFIPSVAKKLESLRLIYKGRVEVDGGINDKTIGLVKDYVDAVVSGSYVCLSDNYNEAIARLR